MRSHRCWTRALACALLTVVGWATQSFATPITDGLVLWLDAADTSTLFQDAALTIPAGVGDSVGGWADKSGNDYNATQTTDSRRPVYGADLMNGEPALRFTAATQQGMIIDPALVPFRPFTAFIVDKYWGSTRGRTLQGTGGTNWLVGLWAGRNAHYADGFTSPQQHEAEIGTVYVHDAVDDFDTSVFTTNGARMTLNDTPTGTPAGFALTGAGTFGEYSDADISEVLIYDRALEETELADVREYLFDKYSVSPIIPPERNTVHFGEINLFSGGDPGEGLDFSGEFQYAVNIGGVGGLTVGDAAFTNDSVPGVSVVAENLASPWGGAPDFGDTENDNNLETIIQSIRWSARDANSIDTVQVQLDGIIPGADYKLQLMFQERCCDRGYDISINGQKAVQELHVPSLVGTPEEPENVNVEEGVVYSYEFTADSDTLFIELDGTQSFFTDGNAILEALTLEFSLPNRGDFNMDGTIDLDDFNILVAGFGTGDNYAEGDFNLDGTVDFHDFRAFKDAFGAAGAAAVPEPSTWLLLLTAGIGLLIPGCRRACRALTVASARLNAAVLLAVLFLVGSAQGQITYNWLPSSGNWNLPANWDDGSGFNFVPDGDLDESAVINNGGTAEFSAGNFDVANLNIGSGTLDMTGGKLTVYGNLVNAGTLRIEGATPELNVEGQFTTTGRLVAAITGANHSRIDVEGAANLNGVLAVQSSGPAPAMGSSWELIQANAISGGFASLDLSGAAVLPRGVQYQVQQTETSAFLSVDNSLILSMDRTTGAASISNVIGGPIEIDGYAIRSDNGLLDSGDWMTLQAGGGGWTSVPGTANLLAELNLSGSSTIGVGESINVGSAYVAGYIRPADEDVKFEYTSPNGDIVQGIVEYSGPVNDIVLAVDPTTGNAEIRNLSPFAQVAASIDGYTIESAAGALRPANWNSFEETGGAGAGWQASPGNSNGLAELNLNSSSLFDQGTAVGIGAIFNPATGARDLVFEYSAIGGGVLVGDANGDNVVGLPDFNILKSHFGESGATSSEGDFDGDGIVGLSDFNLLKSNFGKTGQPGEPGVFRGTVVYEALGGGGAPVPEPSTACLLMLGASGLGVLRIRRRLKERGWMMKSTAVSRVLLGLFVTFAWSLSENPASAQDNEAHVGVINAFNGSEPGAGLDFEGLFQYAVDIGGPGNVQVGDAFFTADDAPGVTVTSDHIITNWGGRPDFGDSPSDEGLETIVHSIRWSEGNGGGLHTVDVQLQNLVPDLNYKLQLLFQEKCCNRAFDILVNDDLVVTEMFAPALQGTPEAPNFNSTTLAAAFTYEFTADSDTLHIQLDGRNTVHQDVNAILNGLTLEADLDLVGDFNLDGALDLDDFATLLENMLVGNIYTEGDINFSGKVDLHDFASFKTAYQAANGAAAVPEPATLWLAACGLLAFGALPGLRRILGRR